MKIAIASDKSGFNLKEAVAAYLRENNVEFEDFGTTDIIAPKPYFDIASTVAPLVASGKYDRGILICGTGMGVALVSNMFKGAYGAACESVYAARMCRAINNANILCMGGWIIAPELGIDMVKNFLATDFVEGVEEWRKDWLKNGLAKVKEIEEKQYKE